MFQVSGSGAPEPEEEEKQTFTRRLSTYDLLLMQISKYDKNKLKKASTVRHQCHNLRYVFSIFDFKFQIDSFVLRRQSLPIGPNSVRLCMIILENLATIIWQSVFVTNYNKYYALIFPVTVKFSPRVQYLVAEQLLVTSTLRSCTR